MKLHLSILLIFSCLVASAQHSVEKLPSPINTEEYDEICPVMSYSEEYLYYTKVGSPDFNKSLIEQGENLHQKLTTEAYDRKLQQIYSLISGYHITQPGKTTFNQDIWYSKIDTGVLGYPVHPGSPINNALPNSICSNYNKQNTFVIVNQFGEEGGMSAGFSRVTLNADGTFTFPTPIEINKLSHRGSDINLAMSADAQHIFLAMDSNDSSGDQDLYVSIKVLEDLYSKPINLGNDVNSRYREATPFISQDKTRLYFSSNRPGGIGGMDIYVCERLDYSYTSWSKPTLIGQPINSPYDDSYPYIALDSDRIFFSTNRDGTSDIYQAQLIRDTLLAHEITIKIKIVNGDTDKKMPGVINWGPAYENGFAEFFNTRNGEFIYTFKDNDPMKFQAENRAIVSPIEILDPIDLTQQGITEVDLVLVMTKSGNKKIVVRKRKPQEALVPEISGIEKELAENRKVVLKSIRFVRSKPDVLAESFPALEELAAVLGRRSDLKIRVEGHTDNVGDKKLLQELSQKRADAIKVILVSRGANSDQIETQGMGHTRPLNGNRNESERQENRRVEIRILEQKPIDKK